MPSAEPPGDTCPNCAGLVYGRFCPTCGMDLDRSPDNPWAEAPEGAIFRAEDFQAEPPSSRRGASVLGVIAGASLVVLLGGLTVGLFGGGLVGGGVATTTSTTSVPVTELPTSAAPSLPPTTTIATPGAGTAAVGRLPAGLLCRDLKFRGLSYPDAVSYWQDEGTPDRMDADRNVIPCETVYPREDVITFWGEIGWDAAGGYLGSLPSGLYCRDLQARGLTYPQAVAYWLSQDMAERMDEDLDSVPCETVYGEDVAADYWAGR